MNEMIGLKGTKTLFEIGVAKQLVSMGHQSCGALELWNYPAWLRDLVPHNVDGTERSDHVDLAALESRLYEPQLILKSFLILCVSYIFFGKLCLSYMELTL
jgi:hypothetical protein